MKRCFLFFISCLLSVSAGAYQTDNLQVSLLTVKSRANHAYTLFGHTALRLYDPSQQIDVVYNWGTYDFSVPNFIYRFVKGETDYFLDWTNYARFLFHYQRGNATVVEQILDLSPEGKQVLLEKLAVNRQPENLVYRYNFLFNNCTTRVRDLIEASRSDLDYPTQKEKTTFRQFIHSCTESDPWLTFGIDLLVGAGADSLIGVRQELFLPVRLEEVLDSTPVVISSEQILTAVPKLDSKRKFWESPLIVGYIILLVYIIIAVTGRLKHRLFKGWFAPLFLVAAAAGSLLAFMAAFSLHPCMWPNWNLLWLHPLHFIGFAGCFFKKPVRWITWYHAGNFIILLGLLVRWHWVPQGLNLADVPYILCLMLASLTYIYNLMKI